MSILGTIYIIGFRGIRASCFLHIIFPPPVFSNTRTSILVNTPHSGSVSYCEVFDSSGCGIIKPRHPHSFPSQTALVTKVAGTSILRSYRISELFFPEAQESLK